MRGYLVEKPVLSHLKESDEENRWTLRNTHSLTMVHSTVSEHAAAVWKETSSQRGGRHLLQKSSKKGETKSAKQQQ